MREILFRGQTRRPGEKVRMNGEKVPGNWVYGGIFPGTGDFSIIYGSADENLTGKNPDKRLVYSDTVGQYTGLTDKNGVKIFEGDICLLVQDWHDGTVEEWYAVVEFGNPNSLYSWGWQLKWISGADNFNKDILLWIDTEDTGATCEVIGNIHDNPELLKGGDGNG